MIRPAAVRLALAGMAGVLILLAAFAVWASQATNRDVEVVARSNSLSSADDAALLAITTEESLTREYLLGPVPDVKDSIALQKQTFEASLGLAASGETAPDRARITQVLAEYQIYSGKTMNVLAAVDGGDQAQAQAINETTDPVFADVHLAMVGLSTAKREEAQVATESLRRLQGTLVAATAPAYGVGVLMLAVLGLIVMAFRRRTDQQAAEFERQALHDQLTGLPNRALLMDRSERLLAAANRNPSTIGIMMLDLDRFKEVNDTLGHEKGDRLLRQVAARLKATLRNSDTVARLGGDEFTILLPDVGSRDDAKGVAKKIADAFERSFLVAGVNLEIQVSIGVAMFPDHGSDMDVLLSRADIAMYVAKRQQTGYVLYSPELDDHGPIQLSRVGDLRQAIEGGDLVLCYQPKADLATAEVVGVEALVRWEHEVLGLIPPADFVPLAERTGLIHPLTEFVLNEALCQCRSWLDSGLNLPVAVNISARNLLDRDFPALVDTLLRKWGLPSPMLQLEITENSLMTDPAGAKNCLLRLTELGVGLSIDDFGTGYSSLAYIKDLPVNELKIDRSFTMELKDHAASRMIVNSIVSLGRNLGLRVVAEGVEDKDAWRQLALLGCDCAQGYFLARPMRGADIAAWRDDWRKGNDVAAMAGPERAIA
jgi:diguanylate cyclase